MSPAVAESVPLEEEDDANTVARLLTLGLKCSGNTGLEIRSVEKMESVMRTISHFFNVRRVGREDWFLTLLLENHLGASAKHLPYSLFCRRKERQPKS